MYDVIEIYITWEGNVKKIMITRPELIFMANGNFFTAMQAMKKYNEMILEAIDLQDVVRDEYGKE